MTLLTIAQQVAKDVGIAVPDTVAARTEKELVQLVSYSNAAADEIARRVDWGQLTASTTLTGTGAAIAHSLPSGFSRLVHGVAVLSGTDVVRPVTRAEWGALTAAEGTPRYFLLEGTTMRLWPYLASAATVTVNYQTKNWCSNGSNLWTADSETAVFPEDILTKGTIVRWRRQKRMEYVDHEAEYEAALADFAGFDNGGRA